MGGSVDIVGDIMVNPLKHFGVNTEFIRGDTSSYNRAGFEPPNPLATYIVTRHPEVLKRFSKKDQQKIRGRAIYGDAPSMNNVQKCPHCRGSGNLYYEPCSFCGGSGIRKPKGWRPK